MVEINNQRKAFLDMLAWSRELITDVRKPEIRGYDVIVGGELFTDYSDHPRQTCRFNQNQIIMAADATSFFPVGGMSNNSLAWKHFSPKSQDAVVLQQIKERGALPMIDRGDIRQAIDRCSNIWLHCRWLWSVRA